MSDVLSKSIILQNAVDTEAIGAQLATVIEAPAIIFLEGPLGAGKTTLVRGFLKGCGFTGHVKSPTFTLVETYEPNNHLIAHFDLYRLNDPEELESIGFRDYLGDDAICLIEWAEKAQSWLPKPSVLCKIKIPAEGEGRLLEIQAFPPISQSLQEWFE